MTLRKVLLSLAVLLLATVQLVLAQGTYTQIDVPGATLTVALGIDNASDVSGFYEDAAQVYHGFLLSSGVYSTIDYPGAVSTQVAGVSSAGMKVALVANFQNSQQGFIYDTQVQTFTPVSYPGQIDTFPLAVNDSGSVAGTFDGKNGVVYGFELIGNRYRKISIPKADGVQAGGITKDNEVVAYARTFGSGAVTNLLVAGTHEEVILKSMAGSPEVLGISPSGTAVVGAYYPVEAAEGFVYSHGAFETILFGNSTTWAQAINDEGEVAGTFVDQQNNIHGFTWTPPANAEKK
jgi:hypothetical protein